MTVRLWLSFGATVIAVMAGALFQAGELWLGVGLTGVSATLAIWSVLDVSP